MKTNITLYLLRHGKTKGNEKGRYIGSMTDEPLSEIGIRELVPFAANYKNVSVDRLLVSPMLRAKETAQILFPTLKQEIVDEFREMNFGDFENKNYKELNGNPDYQAWIDSGGEIAFPNGESKADFISRTIGAAYACLLAAAQNNNKSIAMVVHGGTIMSIVSELTGENYYDFQVKNAEGYQLELEIDETEKINVLSYDRISCRISA